MKNIKLWSTSAHFVVMEMPWWCQIWMIIESGLLQTTISVWLSCVHNTAGAFLNQHGRCRSDLIIYQSVGKMFTTSTNAGEIWTFLKEEKRGLGSCGDNRLLAAFSSQKQLSDEGDTWHNGILSTLNTQEVQIHQTDLYTASCYSLITVSIVVFITVFISSKFNLLICLVLYAQSWRLL